MIEQLYLKKKFIFYNNKKKQCIVNKYRERKFEINYNYYNCLNLVKQCSFCIMNQLVNKSSKQKKNAFD